MKSSNFKVLSALSVVCFSSILVEFSAAQTNFTTQNFNTNEGYVRGSGIISTLQPSNIRWEGNDPYNTNTFFGETDLVARVPGLTPSPLANSSLIQGGLGVGDGILPGTNNVQIWKSFNTYSNYALVSLQTEWLISPSLEEGYLDLDTFAFDLRNPANSASLLKLQFTPGINLLPNSYTLQAIAAGSPTYTPIDLTYDSLFTMQVDITGSTYSLSLTELSRTDRSVITNYSNLVSGNLATGTSSDDFGTIAIDWSLTSGNNEEPGSNYIVVNNIQVIPEPSTYAMLALAGSGLLAFALRRRRA